MFESFKDKLKSWLGKSEKEEPEKTKVIKSKEKKSAKAESKKQKQSKAEKPKPSPPKKKERVVKAEEIKVEQVKKIEEIKVEPKPEVKLEEPEVEVKVEPKAEPEVEEPQKEKKGFFSKIFGKKEKPKEIQPEVAIEEKKEVIVQEKIEEAKVEQVKEIVPDEESKGFFSKISAKLTTSTLQESDVDSIFLDLEIILLENNVALEVVDKIREQLHKDLVGISVKKDNIESTIIQSLKESISSVLIEPPNLIKDIKKSLEPYTIIFFGINGTGKTTSVAKLASLLKKEGISVVLAAADTFRAAAIEQLETHAKRLNVPIIKGEYNSDPTSVAFEAKKYAQTNKLQCILIDTAGRMYTKENLIKQMEKIIRIIKPDLKIFVGESITGNDAIEQVKTFSEAVGIDGIILSKADVDDKGGTALSVSHVTGKPIYYLGTGQNYDDLEVFSKDKILNNLGLD